MNQKPPEKQQPEPRPSVPSAKPEETGRSKGDGKKKKKSKYNAASRIHLTEEQWNSRLRGKF